MRIAVTVSVLLAVVCTALVAVCQHSETRRLQHQVWQLERRRVRLEREAERLEAAVAATRTPRRLLVEADLGRAAAPAGAPARPAAPVAGRTRDAAVPRTPPAFPPGFVAGDNFDGGER